jgi:hypothetical protein
MIFKKKPNRSVYESKIWKHISPLDRTHLILVAEGLKPMAYCSFLDIKDVKDYLSSELGILFDEARGRVEFYHMGNYVALPNRTYTIYASEKIRDSHENASFIRRLFYTDLTGKFLGYPRCCRAEYMKPTVQKKFNDWIISHFPPRAFTFQIECVQAYLSGETIPEEFWFRMPSQTPCSIHCKSTIRLLKKWKQAIYKYDREAAEALKEFNDREWFKKYRQLAENLKKKGITADQFRKGHIFRR